MTRIAPDACTLPSAEQPLRLAEFDELFASSLVEVDRPEPLRLSLLFAGPAGLVEWVQDLTARETACCSFFSFDVRAGAAGSCRVEVRVPPAHADVLEALADRAEAGARR